MRTQTGSLLLALLATVPGHAAALLLTNATVYTAAEQQPRAEAVLLVDDRIAFVGSTAEAASRAPQGTRRLDLRGQTVLPGFTDAHAHLAGIGFREINFNLEGTASLADLQERLRRRVATTKPGEWITGRGWNESRWIPAAFPTRANLDAVAPANPVLLRRTDGHGSVANSMALKMAGIDRGTPDPASGQILKDASGEPNGMLIDTAVDLVQRHVPAITDADTLKALDIGAQRSIRLGWTELQIAGNSLHEVDLLCRLYSEGRIKLRIYDAVLAPGADIDRLLTEGPTLRRCNAPLTTRGIKFYFDGALGSRGALLLAPYRDAPDVQGLILNKEEIIYPVLVAALRRGLQIETHAIGDRANRTVLDLYERAFAAVPPDERAVREPRWRIEHAQVLDPADIPRFAKLGVIASMQPSHAISDLFFAPARLGDDRLAGAYAWHSLLDAGAMVAAGTDAPVEKGDPLIEFYAAVARRSLDGFAGPNWHAEQRVSRDQALKMLTLWAAYAGFQERDRGSIEAGKLADLTVVADDIMTIPEAAIPRTHVTMTIINGEIVYQAKSSLRH